MWQTFCFEMIEPNQSRMLGVSVCLLSFFWLLTSRQVTPLNLRGQLHCPFKSTGSILLACHLHHITISGHSSRDKWNEGGLTWREGAAWMQTGGSMGHASLTGASASTISLFPSVPPSTLLLPDCSWLLPASSCKAWWEKHPPVLLLSVDWSGAEGEGREGLLAVGDGYHGD